jgi:HAD superfamily hydrolase (TIGR01509 family)
MPLRALLWDVDGVLAETERDGHRVAFNQAFEAHGLPWRWSVAHYGTLLAVTGGRERLLHDLQHRSDAPALLREREALAQQLHQSKNRLYAERVQAMGLPLREGVLELMADCRARGMRMAITTTTSRANVEVLLRPHLGPAWQQGFAALVCGEDVARKKPDPAVYLLALQRLAIAPQAALAIEDSPGGVAAACAAGVPVVVTRSAYFNTTTLPGALATGPGLGQIHGWQPALCGPRPAGRITLDDLLAWHQGAARVLPPD